MKYDKIVPEIMVDLGENTVYEESTAVYPKIIHLHMNLENWWGDDLLTSFPEYMATDALKEALEISEFTGFSFHDMEITHDVYFDYNYQLGRPLPKFWWMKITGQAGKDDLYIYKGDLFISEPLLNFIKQNFSTNNLDINPVRDQFDDIIDEMIAKRKS